MDTPRAITTGVTGGFGHRTTTSQWEFLGKVQESCNILHLNRRLTCTLGIPDLGWPPRTHTAHTTWGRERPSFLSCFPIHPLDSVSTEMRVDRPPTFGHSWPCRGPRCGAVSAQWAGGRGRFPKPASAEQVSLEEGRAGDLQQTQGAQPLEGQRRDALEGVVAEDPAGRKEGGKEGRKKENCCLPGAAGQRGAGGSSRATRKLAGLTKVVTLLTVVVGPWV